MVFAHEKRPYNCLLTHSKTYTFRSQVASLMPTGILLRCSHKARAFTGANPVLSH